VDEHPAGSRQQSASSHRMGGLSRDEAGAFPADRGTDEAAISVLSPWALSLLLFPCPFHTPGLTGGKESNPTLPGRSLLQSVSE